MTRRAILAVLVGLLLAPAAAAAPALVGHLDQLEDARLQGQFRIEARDVAVNLTSSASTTPLLSATSGVARTTIYPSSGVTGVGDGVGDATVEEKTLRDARLDRLVCGDWCRIYVAQEGATTPARVEARGALPIEIIGDERILCGVLCGEAPHYELRATPGTLRVSLGSLADVTLRAEGELTLILSDARAEFTTPSGPVTIDALWWREPVAPLPVAAPYEGEARHALVNLSGAVLAAEDLEDGLWAHAATVRADGAFFAEAASGLLQYGAKRIELTRDALDVAGRVAFALDGREVGPVRSLAVAAEATLDGEATLVRVNGVTVGDAMLVAPEAAAPALVGGALVAAVLVGHRFLLAALYARIDRERVLEHPQRAAMIRLLREQPGLSVADLSRTQGIARVVVQHHLRILETHAFVRGTRIGRARRYVSIGAAAPADAAIALALADDPTRRRIALALARRGPLTQRQISEETGLTQRLVSHHLDRLRAHQLVTGDGRFPQRYAPAPELARLGLAEQDARVPGTT